MTTIIKKLDVVAKVFAIITAIWLLFLLIHISYDNKELYRIQEKMLQNQNILISNQKAFLLHNSLTNAPFIIVK